MIRKVFTAILRSPKAVMVASLTILLLGILSYRSLKTDLFPPLNFPILNIITELPSFSSLEMERQVTLPIESAVGGVLGITKVRSTSGTGISMVSAEFQWGTNMLTARQLLAEAIAQIKAQLPQSAEPVMENLSATLAMVEGYSLRGGKDPVALRDTAVFGLKPRLQRIPGVYKVVVMGGKILEYAVYPNPLLMIKFDVSLTNLKEALAANNILATPGSANHFSQELVFHANGQFINTKEIEEVVIAVKNGIPIHVRDLARVVMTHQYERGDTSEKGIPAVLVNIYKQPSFDTGKVAAQIASEVDSFRQSIGSDFSVTNYYDQAQLVEDSIASVKESVWIGAVLVIFTLFIFLRSFRTTIIAAISIPISLLFAICVLQLAGNGLNIMSLGGLAIGTAIIVDDAIVVLENIFRWLASKELKGTNSTLEIVQKATAEVVRPIIVSTLTNIAIFLPMVFIEGFAGKLFEPVSATVTLALIASLIVSVSVIPTFALKWLGSKKVNEEEKEGWLRKVYHPSLRFSLKHPGAILVFALIPVVFVVFALKHLDVEFLPALDEGAVLLQTSMPPGTSLPEAKRIGLKIENWLKDIPGVITVTRRTGHAPGAEDTDNINHSDIMVKLAPKSKRPVALESFIEGLKDKTSSLQGALINYLMPLADKINDALGGVPADLGIDLFGPDLPTLHSFANQLIQRLKQIHGLSDIRPPTDIPVPSLSVLVNKAEAGKLGISEQSIFDSVEAFTSGIEATKVREVSKSIGVVLHYAPAGDNLNREALESLPLKTAGNNTVPLEQVATISYSEIPSEIYHEHLSRKLTFTASLRGASANDVVAEVKKAITDIKLPAGYSYSFSGKYRTEQSALNNMALVLALAILVVGVILWVEFQSMVQVLLILLTIPLAAVGGFLALWICKESLNVSSMIGAVMLVGIVVRNGIILQDYLKKELESGRPLKEAIEEAALKRIRPILMTASVTVLGLFPIALGWGTGSELLRPLAIAVIGGMIVSTLLTLVVLPAASLLTLRNPGVSIDR